MTDSVWFDLSPHLGHTGLKAVLSGRMSEDNHLPREELRRIKATEQGLPDTQLAVPHQVHGRQVLWAEAPGLYRETDGLLTQNRDLILTLQVADCAPVFIYHRDSGTRGLIHAGWRGTAGGIITESLSQISQRGIDLGALDVVIGPSIERDCYEVGQEVAASFPPSTWQTNNKGRFQLDVPGAIREQLVDGGVGPNNIRITGPCTFCDEACHSYRRDGTAAGRMFAYYYVDQEGT